VTKKQTRHCNDLANTKLIPSITPNYIPPLAGMVSHDSVPRDFNYTLITVYLLKGIRVVGPQLGQIMTLNINELNLGDHKNYGMLTLHKYLTKKKEKKSKIIPYPWTMDIVRSTILNVMKIPHFGRHQKVNACIKIMLSCFNGGYLWLDRCITIDPKLIHQIIELSMQGPTHNNFSQGRLQIAPWHKKLKIPMAMWKRGSEATR
jgi:hypothetical protein